MKLRFTSKIHLFMIISEEFIMIIVYETHVEITCILYMYSDLCFSGLIGYWLNWSIALFQKQSQAS